MKQQLTISQITAETIAHYSASRKNRSFVGSQCLYDIASFLSQGRVTLGVDARENYDRIVSAIALGNLGPRARCAIGRVMTDEAIEEFGKSTNNLNTIITKSGGSVDDLLRPEYAGHDKTFWFRLQALHDNHSFWSWKGLSTDGEAAADNILRDFA